MMDPYVVLGVSKSATQDEIRNAYRNHAKKYHPDLNPGNKAAEAKFKNIASAYGSIGTAEERANFDKGEALEQQQQQARASQERRPPFYHETQQDGGRYSSAFGQDIGADDFFESLFRSQNREGNQGSGPGPKKDYSGQDQLYQMSVDFKDAVLGAEREITLPNGKRLQVKIPAGIETGTRLRFKNQGHLGAGKGAAGDAFIEITVRPLAGFKREGNNIEANLEVSFIEALLGAEVRVPTLDGSVMLKIPAGVNTGSRLRIRAKGVATAERGDQIVVITIVLPNKIDPNLQEAVRQWGGKYSYDPRTPS